MGRRVRLHAFVLAACATACALLALLPGPALRVATSTSLLPLASSARPDLKLAFGGSVPISAMGSAFAVTAVLRGTADIALTDVPYRLKGLEEVPVARVVIAVVGGPGTPKALSLRSLLGLLQGRVRNWRALGGEDLPVRLILRTPGSGVRSLLEEFVRGRFAPNAIAALSNGQVLRLVRSLPGAVGFVEAHYAPRDMHIPVDGLLPGSPHYPLAVTGYASFWPEDASARLGAAILAARARVEGMAP